VRYVVAGGRARDIVGTLDWLVEQTAAARGWRIARVRAAAPVEDEQRTSLSQTLATLAGSPVELQVVLDPSLLSGAVIQIGDLQVDATARGRLNALREHLTSGGWDDKFGGGDAQPRGTTTEGAV
jgi:F-type H+-transporting ATPase subunit delta